MARYTDYRGIVRDEGDRLDAFWLRIEMEGIDVYGVESEFFSVLSERVWYSIYNRNMPMVRFLVERGGYELDDLRMMVVLRMLEVWDRVDWSLRNRHKIFDFFVKCGWQVLAQEYRRLRRQPEWVSYDSWVEGEWQGEDDMND